MRFENSITIRRPVPDVFAYLARFENIPQWNYAITQTRPVTPGPVGVGSTYVQQRTLPTASQESIKVTTYEPDHRLAVHGQFGPLPTRATYVVEPVANGTRLTNIMEVDPNGILRVVLPVVTGRLKAAVAGNLDRLKEIVETP